jgi:hypothetical protein
VDLMVWRSHFAKSGREGMVMMAMAQSQTFAPLDVSLPMTVLASVGAGLKVSMTQF